MSPSASAPSVPGRTCSQTSALFAKPTRRGSTTSSLAPRALAAAMSVASVKKLPFGFEPHTTMQALRATSGIGSAGVPKV